MRGAEHNVRRFGIALALAAALYIAAVIVFMIIY